ncbi:transposase [Pontiellaceae bacterium B1224]|nr:transposase [Pontiellaceae bacterium B1224]
MKKGAYDPSIHHRRSIRLKGHDYAGGGLYFITLCAHRDAGNLFGAAAKEILTRIWEEVCRDALNNQAVGAGKDGLGKDGQTQGLPGRARLVCAPSAPPAPSAQEGRHEALPYCIMPDHFHGLIKIEKGEKALGDFICAFKSRTTHEYIRGVKAGMLPPFPGKIWHRNYYEMIVRSAEAEEKITKYIRMNPWRCVQNFGNGLRGMGNPALWNAEKLGVLCSRNAPRPDRIPKAAAYFSGFHSPMEKETFAKLLECKRPVIWCPAWGLGQTQGRTQGAPLLDALENNRVLILEMRDTAGNLAAAEARNRFVLERADRLWLPHVQPGGMLDRLLRETGKRTERDL